MVHGILARLEPAAVLGFVAHASFEWGSAAVAPLWSVAGLFAVLAVPAAHGLVRRSNPYVVGVRAGLAPATAILVAEVTGDPGGYLWWWFLGFAFVYPLGLPRRFGAAAVAVVPVAYAAAAQLGVTGSAIGRASLQGGILLAAAVTGLVAGGVLTGLVGEPDDAEGRLKRKLAVFRAAFDDAATGAALLDLRGNFVRVNQAMEDFLGRSRRELLTMGWGNVVHPDDLRRHSLRIKRLIDGEIWSFQADGRFAMPDRRIRWGAAGMSLITDEAGRPRFILTHVVNVTDARRGEVELRRSEAAYRGVFEVTPVALWRVDLTRLEDLVAAWRRSGVSDLDAHLAGSPEALEQAATAITYLGINDAARRLFGVRDVDEFTTAVTAGGLGDGYRAAVRAMVRARWSGAASIEIGAVFTNAGGTAHEGKLRMVVPTVGRRPALESAVVAFTDPVVTRDRAPGDGRPTAAVVGGELGTPSTAVIGLAQGVRDRHERPSRGGR